MIEQLSKLNLPDLGIVYAIPDETLAVRNEGIRVRIFHVETRRTIGTSKDISRALRAVTTLGECGVSFEGGEAELSQALRTAAPVLAELQRTLFMEVNLETQAAALREAPANSPVVVEEATPAVDLGIVRVAAAEVGGYTLPAQIEGAMPVSRFMLRKEYAPALMAGAPEHVKELVVGGVVRPVCALDFIARVAKALRVKPDVFGTRERVKK